jgi:hypothetical protein
VLVKELMLTLLCRPRILWKVAVVDLIPITMQADIVNTIIRDQIIADSHFNLDPHSKVMERQR